ncbi:hypothetical protein [Roseobacter phage RDJL3]|nr:hypothetical protein [Roseobacter phage RDJL3]
MALKPSRREVVGMVRDKLERHPDLDWTCAVQAVAMEIAWNEQELLEDLAPDFEGENQ